MIYFAHEGEVHQTAQEAATHTAQTADNNGTIIIIIIGLVAASLLAFYLNRKP